MDFSADPRIFAMSADKNTPGDITQAQAYWLSRDTILWRAAGHAFACFLHYSPAGDLRLAQGSIQGGKSISLTHMPSGASTAIRQKFPHLAHLPAYKVAAAADHPLSEILKCQIAVSAIDAHGSLIGATGLQIPGVLDDLYTFTGRLGVWFEGDEPILRLWAPTARSVTLHLYSDARTTESTPVTMKEDHRAGVWVLRGDPSWNYQYYLYEVEVYSPDAGRMVRNFVTDPYSISLATDSTRSQIINLAHSALMPDGWPNLAKPPLEAFEDIVIYELHVRDFSIWDQTVRSQYRGTYMAFAEQESNGMKHLKALAAAGLTHIHLLPIFDIATIQEDKAQRVEPDPVKLAAFGPDSTRQQALISRTSDLDGYNWGYDPYHFTTPEGSYATDPDGPRRILEFREMVQSLNAAGLRVIMDVVYNHTHASGQKAKSVLDKIVPGYYHRLNASGQVETSTCCANTATEHAMMEKLMIDSLVTWAAAYKIDGFRFDLMGHHMLDNMKHARQALDALTLEKDGVDGKKVYLYGEGWDFGELGHNARGVNASQVNIGGNHIGAFNDRMRDAARGGRPFSGLQDQGFITGLWDEPNDAYQGNPEELRFRLIVYQDWIMVCLAGALRSYQFTTLGGHILRSDHLDYNGQPCGYTLHPDENVVYVSAHDNETLFDAIQLKAARAASLSDRIRMHYLGIDLVMLSQGVPFFQAGDDMLRSKSLDRNSFNSGDWFNRLDFTYETNNWGVGLPPGENRRHWPLMALLLEKPGLKPNRADIVACTLHFREMLRIRKSSPLFRLRSAEEVGQRVHFYNTGPHQLPGLIAMGLLAGLVPLVEKPEIMVLFNSSKHAHTFTVEFLKNLPLELHPILVDSADPVVRKASFDPETGTFYIPARTTAVFIKSTI